MYKKYVKRLLDIIFALIALPFWFLLLIIIAPIIYFQDRGPLFYNASRLGRNGKIFKMYKFRSMKVDAPDLRNADGSTYNAQGDDRLTHIGRFIRKTSIDETPQLLNVLLGDMSVVGPRPDLPEHRAMYIGNEKRKLEVRPGVTGYSQAYFRNAMPWKERIQNDIDYIDHMTLWMDIKIVFKTFATILKHENVYVKETSAEETTSGEDITKGEKNG
jgi:lipopolysaccharide/colanic/teichoic acid biosynthesis glycosyltransferase